MHFLLISENEFFLEIKRDGITSLHGIHVKFGQHIAEAPIGSQTGPLLIKKQNCQPSLSVKFELGQNSLSYKIV